jgi:hypothetical protein
VQDVAAGHEDQHDHREHHEPRQPLAGHDPVGAKTLSNSVVRAFAAASVTAPVGVASDWLIHRPGSSYRVSG